MRSNYQYDMHVWVSNKTQVTLWLTILAGWAITETKKKWLPFKNIDHIDLNISCVCTRAYVHMCKIRSFCDQACGQDCPQTMLDDARQCWMTTMTHNGQFMIVFGPLAFMPNEPIIFKQDSKAHLSPPIESKTLKIWPRPWDELGLDYDLDLRQVELMSS